MRSFKFVLLLAVGTTLAQDTKVTPLIARDLPDIPGKEGTMMTVEIQPGAKDMIHRHNAHVFIYVLEDSVVMQLRGGKEVTLGPGGTFTKDRMTYILLGEVPARQERLSF